MGTQATVRISDLFNAGCSLTLISDTIECWDDEAECEVPVDRHSTRVRFPCGGEFTFCGHPNDGSVWADFNRWGSNRPTLEPLLTRHRIEWVEG